MGNNLRVMMRRAWTCFADKIDKGTVGTLQVVGTDSVLWRGDTSMGLVSTGHKCGTGN
jgi:hypothetical protein